MSCSDGVLQRRRNLLSHYAERLALEHRHMLVEYLMILVHTAPRVRVCSETPNSDVINDVRSYTASRPAVIVYSMVTDDEVAVAVSLDMPISGTPPRLRRLAFDGEVRRTFASADDVLTVQRGAAPSCGREYPPPRAMAMSARSSG